MVSSVQQNNFQSLEKNRVLKAVEEDLVVLSVKYHTDVRWGSTAIHKSFTILVSAILVECLHLNWHWNSSKGVDRWAVSLPADTFSNSLDVKGRL